LAPFIDRTALYSLYELRQSPVPGAQMTSQERPHLGATPLAQGSLILTKGADAPAILSTDD
jgi:hypothetical protein